MIVHQEDRRITSVVVMEVKTRERESVGGSKKVKREREE